MENGDQQVISYQQVLENHPVGSASRPAVLHRLANAFILRFKQHSRMEDLDEAIKCDSEAYALCPSDDPNRLLFINSLALHLSDRFLFTKKVEDLDDAVRYYSDALSTCVKGHEYYAMFSNNLAIAKSFRFHHFKKICDLDEAISHYREVLEFYPLENPRHLGAAINLGMVLQNRFEHLHRRDDLEESLAWNRESLSLCPASHSYHYKALVNVATSLHARFQLLDQLDDLNEAIDLFRATISVCPPDDDNRSPYFTTLARALMNRFEHLAQLQDLEDAVRFFGQALELRPQNHREHASCLYEAARSLFVRFTQTSCSNDLEKAISYNRQALTLRPLGHPEHIASLLSVAIALCMQFSQDQDIEVLEEAIKLYRRTMELCTPCYSSRIECLHGFGKALQSRYEKLKQKQDIDSAIVYLREALGSCPPSRRDKHKFLISLGDALATRIDQGGHVEDLDEMIDCNRHILAACPSDHPDRPIALCNAGNGMHMLFRQHGRIEDLEAAIDSLREAVDRFPPTHLMFPGAVVSFAYALVLRFERLGRVIDINSAIDALQKAVALCPSTHAELPSLLTSLAAMLVRRFRIGTADAQALDKAIEHSRKATVASNAGFASFAVLGSALDTRYEQYNRKEDSDEAIACHCKALTLCPLEFRQRSDYFNDLAVALTTRFNKLKQFSDLEKAIDYHRKALDLRKAGHPDRAASLKNLAILFSLRHDQPTLGSPDDLEQALEFFKASANDQSGNARIRASAAERWASVARKHNHPSTLSAYSLTMDLLERCVLLNPSVDVQHEFVSRGFPSLSLDAASWAIEQGELKIAVEMLERGRALLWSKMRGYRHSLEDIRHVHEQLARDFGEVCNQLEHLALVVDATIPIFPHNVSPMTEDERWRRQQHLMSRWDDLLSRIHELDNFEDFLMAVPFARLHAAAKEGPVIIVNISRYRSDALVILHNANSPILIPLPEATPTAMANIYSDFLHSRSATLSVQMGTVLRTLWKSTVSLVVEKLGELGIPSGSRIWWCPTSTLCALPLHAAGLHISGRENLADIYISSYTPTLAALIRARENAPQSESPSLLAIGQLDSSIPMVEREIRVIEELGPSVQSIVGSSATPSAVVDALRMHSWAHFVCHGHLNPQNPFESSFRLHDKTGLTLRAIMQAELPNAELAFLSACHSAAGGITEAPDEVLHLAAAMQFCGFRSVVGTLWEMQDKDGPELAREFYANMFAGVDGHVSFKNAAKALHAAVKLMSAKKDKDVSTVRGSVAVSRVSNATNVYPWTLTFIHIGA